MKTVLVVDDHLILRKLIVEYLNSHTDFQVVGEAKNGLEAIRMVEELQPWVVVMDVRMPILDGIRATQAIKEQWPDVIVISYFGDHGIGLNQEAEAAGAAAHFTKPLDLEKLATRMQELVAVLA